MSHRRTVLLGAILACSLMSSIHGQAANTSSTSTTKNVKTYGKCYVFDSVDMFTDEVSHALICMDSNITDETQVSFHFNRNAEMLSLSKGVQFILEDKVDIAIRVDQGKLRKGTWQYSSNGLAMIMVPSPSNETVKLIKRAGKSSDLENIGFTLDQTLIPALLDEIAKGNRVAIKVGKEGGNISLKGSAAAVADYKARVALRKKVWSRSKTPKSVNITKAK